MHPPLHHSRSARSKAAYIALGIALVVWFGLGAIQAHPIILAVFILPPALLAWDLLKNDTSTFSLSDTEMTFGIGAAHTAIPLDQIDLVRLNRRLDFSWRITVRLNDGQRVRIPPPCIPPIAPFETALLDRNIKIDRVLFAFAG